ncbi:MAG: serine hydrolase domain-containing protein [Gemmatimonadales bacterium]
MSNGRATILALVIWSAATTTGCAGRDGTDAVPEADVRARAELDSLVASALTESGTPGAAVAVVEDGRVVVAKGYGLADREAGAPFTADTRINVASVSKAITTLGVLRLIESGKLRLSDTANARLSSWAIPDGNYDASGVTVGRLLQHTSGLGMPSVPWFPVGDAAPSLVEVLRGSPDRAGLSLTQTPGERWSYSGGGFAVLELLIADLTGRPFEGFMRAEVFGPAGMDSTSYGPHPTDARGYDEAGAPIAPQRYVGSAAAGLTPTAADFARLLLFYGSVWHGESPVIGAPTAELVSAAPVPVELEGVEDASYGLGHGVHRLRGGGVLLYHTGGNPGFRALFHALPGSRSGLFVAVNSDQGVPVLLAVRSWWAERYAGGDVPPLF